MKNHTLVLVFSALLFLCVQAEAQVLHYMMKIDKTVIESKWENDTQGIQCLN